LWRELNHLETALAQGGHASENISKGFLMHWGIDPMRRKGILVVF